MRLEWTDLAVDDLISARERIEPDSLARAERMVERLRAAARRLLRLPNSGRPGKREGTRELSIPGTPYFLVYRQIDNKIQILRVMHSRRNWPFRTD